MNASRRFPGRFLAADYDHWIFGEQRQQRINAAVGRAASVTGASRVFVRECSRISGTASLRSRGAGAALKLCKPLRGFLKLGTTLSERGRKLLHNVLRRTTAESIVGQAPFFRQNVFRQALNLFLQRLTSAFTSTVSP